MRRLAWALLAATVTASANAVPPPPPPIARLAGPAPLCNAAFGFMLASGETADQYDDDYWVVSGTGWSLGIRAVARDEAVTQQASLRERQDLDRVNIPGIGVADRHRVLEYPGNRPRGWAYWFPPADDAAESVMTMASDQFVGDDSDLALLSRVLTGDARDALCPS